MRTTFLNLILLFVIVGCKQPTINKVQQAVEAQAKLLVDSGFFVGVSLNIFVFSVVVIIDFTYNKSVIA